jgi:gliding-associated putative ABC transporter substrate-binding component GldG
VEEELSYKMKGKLKHISEFVSIISILIVLGLLASEINLRIDLTAEKRYTLSEQTRKILRDLDSDIYIQVFLDGDLRVEFSRLRRELTAKLDEFRLASGKKVDYQYINPSGADDPEERYRYQMSLINKGLVPVTIMAEDKEGAQSEKIIFPGLIVNYNGIEMPVNFLRNNPAIPAEQNLIHSIEGLEYELISSIATITSDTIHRIAFIEGHNELSEVEVADITLELAKFFTIDRGTINGVPGILDPYSAIIIAKPESPFPEEDKLVIDQYVMNGGKVMWLVDEVAVNADSLAAGGSMAFYRPLEIEDQLFKYGVRINPVLIQDLDCQIIPVISSIEGAQQQTIHIDWLYNPLLYPSLRSPVTRAINKVRGEFVSYIDTVGNSNQLSRKVLLATSSGSRYVSPPRLISVSDFRERPSDELFNMSYLPVAVSLEGVFPSLFANRINSYNGRPLVKNSVENKMIVIADGDIIRNGVRREGRHLVPLALGQDRSTQQIYGNKDFLVNALNYLVDDKGIMDLRSRELKLRLLDRDKTGKGKIFWQLINSMGPVILVVLSAVIYTLYRKKRYSIRRQI